MPLTDAEYVSDAGIVDCKMLFNTTAANGLSNKWIANDPTKEYAINVDPSAMTVNVDVKILSDVEEVNIFDGISPVEYYDLFGRKVRNPGKGIYIRMQDGKSSKIIL